MKVRVSRAVLRALQDERARLWPEECCGILHGTILTENFLPVGFHIEGLIPARNVHPTPRTHFEIDPQALIGAHRAMRTAGPAVIGYYHSHPSGPAEPSSTDRAMASGDGAIWAIVGGKDVTFWRDDEDCFAKLSYIVAEG
jgi:proteasome lid subunit RPN8/RPN11